ncbi:hypothetical protein AVEN_152468-1 [Araneus ventricosus]|uniref:Uncharacterized protein n=1 Tax=Araneus ventricosus TaxID=182803 RepID=A0A4Y2FKX1_ARAVE|nr:hypothetical protein AVEN_27767-1 [Araneus ventricosus]GBM40314.1 hypothetical protein AVEN_152468-1 [Araneus ventricosus]
MKIGVYRQRCWNPNEVGYPLEWMAIKMKYDPLRRAINHRCVESVGEGESAWELRLDWRNEGVEGAFSKTLKSLVCGRGKMGGRSCREDQSGGSALWSLRE